jgi:hypothetical protein
LEERLCGGEIFTVVTRLRDRDVGKGGLLAG